MLLQWNDECEDNTTPCDNDRTTFEYLINYNLAGGGTINTRTRQIPGPAWQYNLSDLNANNNYEITMIIVAKESNVYSDQSQVVTGTTSM